MNKKPNLKVLLLLTPLLAAAGLGGYWYWNQQNSVAAISESYDRYVEEADAFYQMREYSQAYASYQKAIEKDPRRADAYYGINFILLDKGLNEKAVELMLSAEKNLEKKEVSQLYMQIADEYANDDVWDKAISHYLNSLDYDSDNQKSKKGLFVSYLKVGDLESANSISAEVSESEEAEMLRRYNDLIEENEKDLYTTVDSARVFVNQGYPHLAIEPIKSVAQEADEYWDAWYVLGKAYYEVGDSTNAVDSLEKALVLGSEEAGLYLLLGRLAYEDNQINTAYNYYDRAFNFATGSFKEYVGQEYANILLDEEAYINAIEIASSQADENVPESDQEWRYIVLIKAYIAKDDGDALTQTIESSPEDVKVSREYLIILSDHYLDLEDSAKAEPLIASLKGFDQYDPYYYLYQARLNLLNENPDDALLNLEKSIEFDLTGETTPEAKKVLEALAS